MKLFLIFFVHISTCFLIENDNSVNLTSLKSNVKNVKIFHSTLNASFSPYENYASLKSITIYNSTIKSSFNWYNFWNVASNVQSVHVTYTNVFIPTIYGEFIKELDFSGNWMPTTLKVNQLSPNTWSFFCNSCNITMIHECKKVRHSLDTVHLSSNPFTYFPTSCFENIVELALNHMFNLNHLKLCDMRNLEILYFSENYNFFLNGRDINNFSCLAHLKVLQMENNLLTSLGNSTFKKLKILDVSYNLINQIPETFPLLYPSLKSFKINNNKLLFLNLHSFIKLNYLECINNKIYTIENGTSIRHSLKIYIYGNSIKCFCKEMHNIRYLGIKKCEYKKNVRIEMKQFNWYLFAFVFLCWVLSICFIVFILKKKIKTQEADVEMTLLQKKPKNQGAAGEDTLP